MNDIAAELIRGRRSPGNYWSSQCWTDSGDPHNSRPQLEDLSSDQGPAGLARWRESGRRLRMRAWVRDAGKSVAKHCFTCRSRRQNLRGVRTGGRRTYPTVVASRYRNNLCCSRSCSWQTILPSHAPSETK